jgi:hypothetical protein
VPCWRLQRLLARLLARADFWLGVTSCGDLELAGGEVLARGTSPAGETDLGKGTTTQW